MIGWHFSFILPVLKNLIYFPGGSDGKAFVYNAGDLGLIPGWGKFPGEGNGNSLQYSCLENPMDGGAWCPWGCKELDTTERLNWTELNTSFKNFWLYLAYFLNYILNSLKVRMTSLVDYIIILKIFTVFSVEESYLSALHGKFCYMTGFNQLNLSRTNIYHFWSTECFWHLFCPPVAR